MIIIDKLFNKKTNFEARGLLVQEIPVAAKIVAQPEKFVAPKSLDFRDMCIETSYQGNLPHCAGYATAGFIEVRHWRSLHYPKQFDGDAIYMEAKKTDNWNGPGTYLPNAAKAAIDLGYIQGSPSYVQKDRMQLKFAIHEYSSCIASFVITDEWNYVDKNGRIPNWNEKAQNIGGHAVLCCGYNSEGVFIQNSWGTPWGLYGFALLGWEQFDRQFQHGMVIR